MSQAEDAVMNTGGTLDPLGEISNNQSSAPAGTPSKHKISTGTPSKSGGWGRSAGSRFSGPGSIYGSATKQAQAPSSPALKTQTPKKDTPRKQTPAKGRFDSPGSIYAQGKNASEHQSSGHGEIGSASKGVGWKKPKRSRLSEVHSIHGDRKIRERAGGKALHAVGLSDELLQPAEKSKGGGYVPTAAEGGVDEEKVTKDRFEAPGSIYEQGKNASEHQGSAHNDLVEAATDKGPEWKKPKRSRFSEVYSIHGDRKLRERGGGKALDAVGLSDDLLKPTEQSKGGGYVPTVPEIAEGGAEGTSSFKNTSDRHTYISASCPMDMREEGAHATLDAKSEFDECSKGHSNLFKEGKHDRFEALGGIYEGEAVDAAHEETAEAESMFDCGTATTEKDAKWKKGKHGRFSTVGSIYKEEETPSDESTAESEVAPSASTNQAAADGKPSWKEGKHGRFSMAGSIYTKQ
jgi:hypothetical protein